MTRIVHRRVKQKAVIHIEQPIEPQKETETVSQPAKTKVINIDAKKAKKQRKAKKKAKK